MSRGGRDAAATHRNDAFGGKMGPKTIKCPICGQPYHFYSHYAGDQSACNDCRVKAKEQLANKDTWSRRSQEMRP